MTISGIITAMATPIDDNGAISEKGIEQLVNHLLKNGVSGLFILGTNGEFFSFTDEEKVAYAELVVKVVANRVPVYVGTGGISTKAVISLSKKMEGIGVSAISIITPFLMGLSQKELYQHYKTIAQNTSLPIILYNIPQNTKNNLEAKTVGQLAQLPNIIGIKDSSGDLKQLEKYIKLTHSYDFSVLVGSDSKILKALKLGATGAVAATSNVLTKTDVAIYDNFIKQDFETAEKFQKSIDDYRKILKYSTVPSVLKYTMNKIGLPVGETLSPIILDLTEAEKIEIDKVLSRYQEYEAFGGIV